MTIHAQLKYLHISHWHVVYFQIYRISFKIYSSIFCADEILIIHNKDYENIFHLWKYRSCWYITMQNKWVLYLALSTKIKNDLLDNIVKVNII